MKTTLTNPVELGRTATVRLATRSPDRVGGPLECASAPRSIFLSALLLPLLAVAPSVLAQQTVALRLAPVRVTVPFNGAAQTEIAFQATIADGNAPVTLSIADVPAGVSYTFSANDFTETTTGTLTLNTTDVPEGEHVLKVEASGGATATFLLTLQSGHVWSGADTIDANWSTGGNWVGGAVPGASSDVLFTDLGGQGSVVTNSIVDVDTEIASLRFSPANSGSTFHTLLVQPNHALAVTGEKGLKMLRDYTDIGQDMTVTIAGQEGTVIVSNAAANIALLVDNQRKHTLDMSGLGTFIADVNRVGLGDYRLYPNYDNLRANGFGGTAPYLIPRRFIPTVRLARTNIIRAVHVDPNDYMDPVERHYSLTLGNNEVGTTADCYLYLGISNVFNMDSLCLIQSSAQGDPGSGGILFNSAFSVDNPVAVFRGTDGGRMSVLALADAAGVGPSGTASKAIVNLSGGAIDAFVDKLYLARDRTDSSDNASAEATLTIAKGVLDANTAILGFQGNGNNQNVGGGNPRGYCRGTMNVNADALFVVNSELELGHTTADPGDIRQAELGYGRLSITGGGEVRANTITVGGVTKVSGGPGTENSITISGDGSVLVLTNTLGEPTPAGAKLGILTISTGGTLALASVNAAAPSVHVKNLMASGGFIEILSVPAAGTYPLISYDSAAPNLTLKLPEGFYGYVVDNAGNKTIDAVISTAAPKTVLWRGNISGDWDTTTLNWVDAATLTATNFTNGDAVVFDDDVTGSVTVNVVGTVVPAAGTTFNNSVRNYTLTGGTIAGTAATVKTGAADITFEAIHAPPLTVSNGTFIVNPPGILNGGLTSHSLAENKGTINGPVSIQAGSFVNSGTVSTAPGTMTIAANTTITNLAPATMNVAGGNWSVAAGATLANFGTINNQVGRLNIDGTLMGTGIVADATGTAISGTGRLAINNKATISVGSSIGTMEVQARLDLNNGSSTIVEVDLNNPQVNDKLTIDYGGNLQTTFVMNNVGAIPFAPGQTFTILSGNFGVVLTNANATHVPKVSPVVPGVGLQWDVSGMVVTNVDRTISVVGAPSTPPEMTSLLSNGTLTLTWPATHLGWQLMGQTNSLDVGISPDWYPVPGSEAVTSWGVAVDTANPTVFFKLSNH